MFCVPALRVKTGLDPPRHTVYWIVQFLDIYLLAHIKSSPIEGPEGIIIFSIYEGPGYLAHIRVSQRAPAT